MKILVLITIMIVAIISFSLFSICEDTSDSQSKSLYDTGFTYYDIEKIKTSLAEQNIFISTPVAITDHTISQYCTFFDDNNIQKTVQYCTTTVILDSEGNTLGNINIGGDTNSPILAIANLETSSLDSKQDEVYAVFQIMIQTLVCDCWDDQQSEDFESISAWIDAAQMFYATEQRNITSKIDGLGEYHLILEITSKENSILQTLIILK